MKAAADRSREAVAEAYRQLEERAEQLVTRRLDAGRVLQESRVEHGPGVCPPKRRPLHWISLHRDMSDVCIHECSGVGRI